MESYLPCLWISLVVPVCKYQVMHSLCTGELKDQEVLGSVPHDQQTTWPLLQTHSPWERCARISECRSALQLRLEQMASLFTSCHVLCSSRERNTGSRKSSPTEKEKWGQEKLKAGENGRVEGNQLAHVHNSREPSWSVCGDLVVVFYRRASIIFSKFLLPNVLPPLLPFDPLFFARENTRSVNESQPQAKGIAFKHSWLLEAKQVDLVRANTYSYKLMKLKARHACFFKVG